MKFPGAFLIPIARRAGIGFLIAVLLLVALLVLRAMFKSPEAEAATNTFNPGFCLGGWENPDAAAGLPGKTEPNGGSSAAYLAPDVFAQIFCGYFAVTERTKPPKAAQVTFSFSFSGEAPPAEVVPEGEVQGETDEEPSDEGEDAGGGGGGGSTEEPPAEEVPADEPAEEVPADEPSEIPSEPEPEPVQEAESEPSSEPSAFMKFLLPTAHAQEVASENFLVVSYSFDGVRWYAAGRVNRQNAEKFTMNVPATMWNELQNLQVMAAPLPISGDRPKIYLESVDLKVEADLTIGEIAADSAAAVGGVLGEVLGFADTVQTAAVTYIAPPAFIAPPAKVKKLFYEIAGNPINTEGAGRDVPNLTLEDNNTTLRVAAECDESYFVVLTYRSIEDFMNKPRSFVSNYAGECKGKTFTYRMDHMPVDTPEDVYYLVVGEQGEEGSWTAISPLMPIKIGQKEVVETKTD